MVIPVVCYRVFPDDTWTAPCIETVKLIAVVTWRLRSINEAAVGDGRHKNTAYYDRRFRVGRQDK